MALVKAFDMAAAGSYMKPKSKAIVFLKTHKTGSSTIQNVLLRYGDMNRLLFAFHGKGHQVLTGKPLPKWLLPCENEKPDIFCFHTDYDMNKLSAAVKPNATFVTILRNPNFVFHSLYRLVP